MINSTIITNIVTHMVYKFIKDLLLTKNFTDSFVLDLYVPIINVKDEDPIYLTKTTEYKKKVNTQNPNTYTYTEDVNDAIAFKDKADINTIIELQGLEYSIVQFKDMFTKAYTVVYGSTKPNEPAKLYTHTSWKPHGYTNEEPKGIVTTNHKLGCEKLSDLKYRLVKSLQDKIVEVAKITLTE